MATANIGNNELIALFEENLDDIVNSLDEVQFVELRPGQLIVHEAR